MWQGQQQLWRGQRVWSCGCRDRSRRGARPEKEGDTARDRNGGKLWRGQRLRREKVGLPSIFWRDHGDHRGVQQGVVSVLPQGQDTARVQGADIHGDRHHQRPGGGSPDGRALRSSNGPSDLH